ncbi:hypothetical protein NKR23_g1919 [Pleurostoma richardsiae]|uniref:Uncharacterized protein n=1 Tax=Pleurostoma richardsiae TaxID=41990 RepID=A0AA38SB50_9PEZI|nr:hypothetical protein NKR23_g1919 [Pleurostoma richardsiae]
MEATAGSPRSSLQSSLQSLPGMDSVLAMTPAVRDPGTSSGRDGRPSSASASASSPWPSSNTATTQAGETPRDPSSRKRGDGAHKKRK